MLKPALALFAIAATPALAQPITPAELSKINKLVNDTLADTGVPAASIAIVRDGKIVLTRAYGKANEGLPARPDQPYQIASNSKQFTAMGLMLLEDEGKLDLDDKVAKYFPDVTGADKISIRQLLSHTSGLQDFWPQDYSFADMKNPATPQLIVDKWAKKPLDFEPGTRWQYSNTGYVVAGMILEKAAGEPMLAYLQRKIFAPLDMHPLDLDETNTPAFPAGYHRSALGPVRVAEPAADGWLWAAGELSMTAEDLAKWDIARMNRALIPADDWIEQETPILRADGRTNGYGLGVYNHYQRQRHVIDHGGEAVGFLTQNTIYPDTKDAIIVFTNSDFSGATDTITEGLEQIVLDAPEHALTNEGDRLADARAIYSALLSGKVDRSRFTDNLNYYFNDTVLGDYRTSLAPLGTPKIEITRPPRLRGGFVNRVYRLVYPKETLVLSTYAEPGNDGRWEQFIVMPE